MKSILMLIIISLLAMCANQAFAASDKQHFPGIFLGYTHVGNNTEFTYGIEYEYKFSTHWGAGLVYEETDDGHYGDGITVKVASLFYHPYSNLRLGLGIGNEKIGGAHPHKEDLIRLSASYEYLFGDFGLAPVLAVDFIDGEEAYVMGIAIIRPF